MCFDFQDKYSDKDIEALNSLHTRQLLKMKNINYKRSEYCCDMCDKRDPECRLCISNRQLNREQIKAILDTREHVPNKKEAKEIRRQRIKEGI